MTRIKNAWAWIKRKWKKVLLAIAGVFTTTALALNVAGFPPESFDSEAELLIEIQRIQEIYVQQHGKYARQKPRSKMEFEEHEYVSPHDGPGHQVIFMRTIEITYQRETTSGSGTFEDATRSVTQTKSFGYGPEAQNRTWKWR